MGDDRARSPSGSNFLPLDDGLTNSHYVHFDAQEMDTDEKVANAEISLQPPANDSDGSAIVEHSATSDVNGQDIVDEPSVKTIHSDADLDSGIGQEVSIKSETVVANDSQKTQFLHTSNGHRMNPEKIDRIPYPTFNRIPEPTMSCIPEPTINRIPEPTINHIPEPTINRIPDATINRIPEPTTNRIPGPTINRIPESTINRIPDATINRIPEPTINRIPEPTMSRIPGPTISHILNPINNRIPEPITNRQPQTIDIRVTSVANNGKCFKFQLKRTDKVSHLNALIYERINIPTEQQILIYNTKKLVPSETLCHYGIENDSEIMLQLRLRGG